MCSVFSIIGVCWFACCSVCVCLCVCVLRCVVLCVWVCFVLVYWDGVWCGGVWCGVVWCGVVWRGVVWCGVWARTPSPLPFTPAETQLSKQRTQGGPKEPTLLERRVRRCGHRHNLPPECNGDHRRGWYKLYLADQHSATSQQNWRFKLAVERMFPEGHRLPRNSRCRRKFLGTWRLFRHAAV